MNFDDAAEVASYDARQGGDPAEDRGLLEGLGLGVDEAMADIGCGTGMLVVEAAKLCREAHAVDISTEMLGVTLARAKAQNLTNVVPHRAGFLSYELPDSSLDLITSKFALHHLPDLWKGVALARLHRTLKPGGRLFLRDVVFSCDPAEIPTVSEEWIAWMSANTGYSRAEVAQHIRDEHSTFSWIMAGLIERAGFRINHAEYSMRIYADYIAEKT
ncbi:class I SAM-dependent methyltransferase [Dongia sp.]|uniref:class I SAM-dependent methyltransferase n=1 Tax=Dongia sp. TaxID=1977262 RepID=UPI0035AE2E99